MTADVILTFSASTTVGSSSTPFQWANGANYGAANTVLTYVNTPNAASTAETITLNAVSGAFGTYMVDVLIFHEPAATAQPWGVTATLVSGITDANVLAAYATLCPAAAEPAVGSATLTATSLASGAGYNIFQPTCTATAAGVIANMNLLNAGVGVAHTIYAAGAYVGTAAGYSNLVVYVDFEFAIAAAGVTGAGDTFTFQIATLA